ncbi:hypothetical protein ACFLVN_04830 [Chloroflexota bacterium]
MKRGEAPLKLPVRTPGTAPLETFYLSGSSKYVATLLFVSYLLIMDSAKEL